MPVSIVDPLKMIDIAQTDADLCFCGLEKIFQIFHGAPAVI